MTTPTRAPTRATDEEDLDELPPLDGDGTDAPEAADGAADEDDLDDLGDDADMDDATGEGDPVDPSDYGVGEPVDARGGGWLDEPSDAAGLDIGGDEIVELDEELGAEDEGERTTQSADDDNLVEGLGEGPEHGGLDGGDEGPTGADEELRDEDLPRLDADEEGEVDDASLVDPSFGSEEAGLPWAAEPWERVGAPVPVSSAVAIACAGRGAVVVGRAEDVLALLRVDLEGACQGLPARGLEVPAVVALARDGERVVAELASGASWASADLGATFEETAPRVSPAGLEAPPPEARRPVAMVARAEHAACAGRGAAVLRRLGDHGWASIACGGPVTALAFLDDDGALLAASYVAADDTTTLVRIDVAGRAAVVARVGASRADADSDGQARAMALDAARGVVWVAGGFGVAAFAVR